MTYINITNEFHNGFDNMFCTFATQQKFQVIISRKHYDFSPYLKWFQAGLLRTSIKHLGHQEY